MNLQPVLASRTTSPQQGVQVGHLERPNSLVTDDLSTPNSSDDESMAVEKQARQELRSLQLKLTEVRAEEEDLCRRIETIELSLGIRAAAFITRRSSTPSRPVQVCKHPGSGHEPSTNSLVSKPSASTLVDDYQGNHTEIPPKASQTTLVDGKFGNDNVDLWRGFDLFKENTVPDALSGPMGDALDYDWFDQYKQLDEATRARKRRRESGAHPPIIHQRQSPDNSTHSQHHAEYRV